MYVTMQNLPQVIANLQKSSHYGIDTETYGLMWHHKLFSLQIACGEEEAYYFNFYYGEDYLGNKSPQDSILPKDVLSVLSEIFNDESKTWYIHNSSFDISMLLKEGIEFKGKVHCTLSAERVIRNNFIFLKGWGAPYSLSSCAKRRKWEKDDAVSKCIDDNHLWDWVTIPGKKRKDKNLYFYKVPFETLVQYGEMDAILAYKIGKDQEEQLHKLEIQSPDRPSPVKYVQIEFELRKLLSKMESTGIRLDIDYCKKALAYSDKMILQCKKELDKLTGVDREAKRYLKQCFDKFDYSYKTKEETGNPIFDKVSMREYDNPISKKVLELRNHEKHSGTFYSSFLYHADGAGDIRCSLNPAGAASGRFTCSRPNLQQVPTAHEGVEYVVRKCFVPRKGFFFLSIDYMQMEYRLMLDYANEKVLINSVMAGEDVHQATANVLGISRKKAKTIGFALLYSAGDEKLGDSLGISKEEAHEFKEQYFSKLPAVSEFIRRVKQQASIRGFIYSLNGRRLYLTNKESYKAVNYLIQGSSSEITKIAMVRIGKYLADKKSRILLSIHDEVLLEISYDELYVQKEIMQIMRDAYTPKNGMIMDVSAEHSEMSWGGCDMKDGIYGK